MRIALNDAWWERKDTSKTQHKEWEIFDTILWVRLKNFFSLLPDLSQDISKLLNAKNGKSSRLEYVRKFTPDWLSIGESNAVR